MGTNVVFAHERLVAYQRAFAFLECAARLLRGLPRGEAHLADQLRRAGDSVLLNIAEGAGRTAGRERGLVSEPVASRGRASGPRPRTQGRKARKRP